MQTPLPTHHATSVAYAGAGVLILGRAGAGKSALALELISRGAELISDDRTSLQVVDGQLQARAPESITGMIEARGGGILRLPAAGPTTIQFVVDLDHVEPKRLPISRSMRILQVDLPCFWRVEGPHFAAAILLCLAHGIPDPA